jgi:glucose-6-phosphate 1-epimerase
VIVVWNPWIEKAKAMTDFDNDEYLKMVCVEVNFNPFFILQAGAVSHSVPLNPGQVWKGSQTLIVSKL